MNTRFTERDLRILYSAVAHLSAGEWSETVDEDIELGHIEAVLDKVTRKLRKLEKAPI